MNRSSVVTLVATSILGPGVLGQKGTSLAARWGCGCENIIQDMIERERESRERYNMYRELYMRLNSFFFAHAHAQAHAHTRTCTHRQNVIMVFTVHYHYLLWIFMDVKAVVSIFMVFRSAHEVRSWADSSTHPAAKGQASLPVSFGLLLIFRAVRNRCYWKWNIANTTAIWFRLQWWL